MITLAGDIGGTNCRLAIYKDGAQIFERSYPSAEFTSLDAAAEKFMAEARKAIGPDNARAQRACLGVAGPVDNGTSRATNLPWFIEAKKLENRLNIPKVLLVNDFQAAALGVTLLQDDQVIKMGGGERNPKGPIVVAGAGTGLGEAFLVWSPGEDRYQVIPSEGGHVDFTPRTSLEAGLFHYLSGRYGRVSFERVLSGAGIADVFEFLTNEPACRPLVTEETRQAIIVEPPAAVITRMGVEGKDPVCLMTLNIFMSVLGGLLGNLALTMLASGGVYIAGGIAPRLSTLFPKGPFRESFEAKGRMQQIVARIPTYLVMHKDLGLLGAHVHAERI